MADKKRTGRKTKAQTLAEEKRRLREKIVAVCLIALALFLAFAMFLKAAGIVGEGITYFLNGVFGPASYAIPFLLLLYAILILRAKRKYYGLRGIIVLVFIILLFLLLVSGFFLGPAADPLRGMNAADVYRRSGEGLGGGVFGMVVGAQIIKLVGKAGLFIFTILGLIILALVYAGNSLSFYWDAIRGKVRDGKERREERRAEEAFEESASQAATTRVQDFGRPSPAPPGAAGAGPDPYQLQQRQQNIVEAVVTESQNITGAQAPPAPDVLAPPPPEKPDFGIEPPRFVKPGYGIEDADIPDTYIYTEQPQDVPFTEQDLGADAAAETGSNRHTARIQKFGTGPAGGLAPEDEAMFAGTDGGEAPVKVRKKSNFRGTYDSKDALLAYKLPPVSLLKSGPKGPRAENAAELRARSAQLEQTLRDFRVDAKVINVTIGPTVTRYEVEPDVGVKIQSIKSLEPDLARKLEVKSVRVVSIPGQSVVGIEAFNAVTQIVSLKEMIDSPEFRGAGSKISFALGKNVSGERIVADLAAMPHLLIAGTTGAGKSVCINDILLSILFRARPDEVKLILIDPKMVELKLYNDIPHLLVPVVTNAERAAIALSYAVTLMTDRFDRFAGANVRDIQGYNEKMGRDGRAEDVMPQIVIVIDELSDLMMVASQKVQDSISRLAAMGRAAGMHLIVATQQPLASILTSVIKANIPSRIAFSVSSNTNSRVILDEPGAERLLGKGDGLFSPVGTREPMRIQCAYVTDSEVYKVTEFIKNQMDPEYSPDVVNVVENGFGGGLVDDEDELFRDAVEMVVQAKQASVSMIQRRFRIGYNRSARLVDMMEERGIVAPSDGQNKPRKVLMTDAQLASFLADGQVQLQMEDLGTAPGPAAGDETVGGEESAPPWSEE
ncbi:MAG: DNA translocase FtsK [Clostridiales Family XIII bacterium]|jgi:S-DNA-T family DNA segregation ATPase FtsK/SpoIIIE|nr:DNA translocase FtsK [Clostridiales Family XIII bacterium]